MAAAMIFVPGTMPTSDRNRNGCVGELYFYANDGTYTPKSVYTASDLATPHPFPVLSDASGMFPAIWADSSQQFTVAWKTREADPQTVTLLNVSPAVGVIVGPGTGNMLSANNLSDVQSAATSLANLGGLPKAGGSMSGPLSLAADAVNPLEPATKQQLDSAILNAGRRSRVRVATTANVTISTALNNGDVLDGVTLVTGDLVLVKNQTSQADNGVYVVGVTPVRSTEFDTWAEFPGSLIAVAEGSTNNDTVWICTSNDGGTLGTTAIVFSRIRIDIAIPVAAAQGGTGMSNSGATGNVLTADGAGGWASSPPSLPGWDFIAQDEKASGTTGGNSVNATRVDRAFGTVKRNTLGLTVTPNTVTLTPGVWLLKGAAPLYGGVKGRTYLWNDTLNTDFIYGRNAITVAGGQEYSEAEVVVTVATNSILKLQQYTDSVVTDGLGKALGTGGVEVFSVVLAKKIA